MDYENDNVFAKILRGELPCTKVYEDENVLAFNDINPKTPVHVLVVPKAPYVDFSDFVARAAAAEQAAFWAGVQRTAEATGVAATGFRVVTNNGASAGQIVFHFHVHIYGGRPLGGRAK